MGSEIMAMELAGSAYERGLVQGRQMPELIRKAVASWGDAKGAHPETVASISRRLETNSLGVCPEAVEEMRGLAEGSGIDYEDILRLNFCESIWNDTVGWCTNGSFLDGSPGPILGKNSDIWDGDQEFHFVQRVTPDRGYSMLRCGFAGYIGVACGINEAGLAYGGSSVKVTKGSGRDDGVDGAMACAMILQQCATVDEAVRMAATIPLASHGLNATFIDKSGRAAVIEMAPSGKAVRSPEQATTYHTNHFISLDAPEELKDQPEFLANSRARIDTVSRLVNAVDRTPEGMMRILRDHSDTGPICQHGGCDMFSVVSHVLLPSEGRMFVTEGFPCQNEYVEFSL